MTDQVFAQTDFAVLQTWVSLLGSRTSLTPMEDLTGSRSPPSPHTTHLTWQVKSYEKNTFLLDVIFLICVKSVLKKSFSVFWLQGVLCRGLSGALDPSACWGLSPSCSVSLFLERLPGNVDLYDHCNSISQTRAGIPRSESSAAGIELFSSADWQQQWLVIKRWVVTDVWALMMNMRV